MTRLENWLVLSQSPTCQNLATESSPLSVFLPRQGDTVPMGVASILAGGRVQQLSLCVSEMQVQGSGGPQWDTPSSCLSVHSHLAVFVKQGGALVPIPRAVHMRTIRCNLSP